MDEELRQLGERIKRYRIMQRITQEDLAEKAKICVQYLSRIERGVVNPSYKVLLQLSRGLSRSITELTTEEPERMRIEETYFDLTLGQVCKYLVNAIDEQRKQEQIMQDSKEKTLSE